MEKLRDQHEKTFLTASAGVLDALIRLFGHYPDVELAALFGSRARGDFTARSDYDIAVFGNVTQTEKARLRAACCDDLPTLHKIDLIFADEVTDKNFMKSIQTEGIVFYDKAAK